MINKQQEIRKHILTIGNDVVKQKLKEIDDLEKKINKIKKSINKNLGMELKSYHKLERIIEILKEVK